MHDFSLLSKVSRSSLRLFPFPHYVIENALPQDLYDALDQEFPEDLLLSDSSLIKNDRNHTRRLLAKNFLGGNQVSNLWQEFAKYHTSQHFLSVLAEFFFYLPIQQFYPKLPKYISKMGVDLRTNDPLKDQNKLVTDFQFVANLPYGNSHISRTPHLDNPKEIYACLFYMKKKDDRSIGGGLDFYQPKDSAKNAAHAQDRAIDVKHLNYIKTVHYSANTAVIFLNTKSSYHGVQPIFEQSLLRRSINIIGELPLGSQLFKI